MSQSEPVTTGDRPSGIPVALQAARRLLERERANHPQLGSVEHASALYRTWTSAVANLRESLGDDGCEALLARATPKAQSSHPAVVTIDPLAPGGVTLERLVGSIGKHGGPATAAAIEALIAALLIILARLIGEDMALRVIDHESPASPWDAQAPESE